MRKYHGRSYLEQKIFSLLLVTKLESLVTVIFFSTFMRVVHLFVAQEIIVLYL